MHQISEQQIRRTDTSAGRQRIAAVTELCPHCGERGTFTTENNLSHPTHNVVIGTGKCPSCSKSTFFWSINVTGRVEFFMHPSPSLHKKILDGSGVPDPIARSYNSSVDALNSRNFVATAVLCRRTLEGLFKLLAGSGGKNLTLAQAITKVSENQDLSLPLKHLADAVRHGGNLAAHFDEDREPTPEMAEEMVELVEYIIDFIHILPNKIEKLNNKFLASSSNA